MLKVIIADDEARIRKGLSEAINWEEEGFILAGLAKNGQELLDLVKTELPDICLVDICMPKLSGFEVIQHIKEIRPDTECIVVTGHDEFDFAQQAIQLAVLDYILKPVQEEKLLAAVRKAATIIKDRREIRKRFASTEKRLNESMTVLRGQFIFELLAGKLSSEEIAERAEFYGMDWQGEAGFILVNTSYVCGFSLNGTEREYQLLSFAVRETVEVSLASVFSSFYTTLDSRENIVAIIKINDNAGWATIEADIEEAVKARWTCTVKVRKIALKSLCSIPEAYEDLLSKTGHVSSEWVTKVQEIVGQEIGNADLSFSEVANTLKLNISYLSRQFKKETGMTFVDYVNNVRIKKALELMKNPSIRICEIADKVGYKSQNYFSVTFKRIMGQSPSEFRQI